MEAETAPIVCIGSGTTVTPMIAVTAIITDRIIILRSVKDADGMKIDRQYGCRNLYICSGGKSVMKKQQLHGFLRSMVMIVLMTSILLLFASCSKSAEEQLVGSWYIGGKTSITRDGTRGPIFVFYDDGTCELATEYGTGRWSVVNEVQLEITTFYGESHIATIVSIENGELILEADGTQMTYLSEPQNG